MKGRKSVVTIIITLLTIVFVGYYIFSLLGIIMPQDSAFGGYLIGLFIMVLCVSLIPIVLTIRNGKIKNKKISLKNVQSDLKFEEIYSETRNKYEADLNKIRKSLRPITAITTILAIILLGIYVFMKTAENNIYEYPEFIIENPIIIRAVPVVAVLLFFVAWVFYTLKKSDYDKKYKEGVVKDLVNKVHDGLAYTIYPQNDDERLLNSYDLAAFDTHRYNRSVVEDCINGKITENLSLSLAELYLREEWGTGKNRRSVDVFNGIFVKVAGISDFKGTIKILNNSNKMGTNNSQNLKEVKMDSSEFESIFNVYADNPVIAMQVLTSDIMEKMVEFKNRLDIHYEVLVSGTEVYMRLFTNDLFEPAIFN